MITALAVLNDIESEFGVEVRFGQGGLEQQDRLLQSQVGSLVLEADLETNQQEMGQDTKGHVVMPAGPTVGLVVAQAEFLLAVFKAGFDGPAHPA